MPESLNEADSTQAPIVEPLKARGWTYTRRQWAVRLARFDTPKAAADDAAADQTIADMAPADKAVTEALAAQQAAAQQAVADQAAAAELRLNAVLTLIQGTRMGQGLF
jgi:hypothetical protein